jgi:hypothetical protein
MDVLLPVIDIIKKDNFYTFLVIVPENFDAFDLLDKHEIPYKCLKYYFTSEVFQNAFSSYSSILKEFDTISHNRSVRKQLYSYNGYSLDSVLACHIKKTFYFSLKNIAYVLLMKRIIDIHNPSVFFTPHFSESIIKSLSSKAKTSNIPVVQLFRGTAGLSAEYSLFSGDKLLLSGKNSMNIFSYWGIDSSKMRITGIPIFDDLLYKIKYKHVIKEKIYGKLNVNKNWDIITYITQSLGNRFGQQERIIEIKTIFEVVKSIENVFLIIKLHPTEVDTEIYSIIAKEIGLSNYIISKDLDLDEILISSKIALTKTSTAGFNAIIAGCSLVTMDFHENKFHGNFFINNQVSFAVSNLIELKSTIIGILANDSNYIISESCKRKFLESHFYNYDNGRSSFEIRDAIYSALQKPSQ